MTSDGVGTGQRPQRQPGSQAALREGNERRCLDVLASAGPSTQADLSRVTGLSTATISNIVHSLLERGAVTVEPTTSSGRRALLVRLNSRSTLAAGVDFGRTHVRVALATPSYEVVAERAVDVEVGHTAKESIEVAAEVLDGLLAECGLERSAIVGLGVGVPGPLDPRTLTVIGGSILPDWVGTDVPQALRDHFEMPIFVDNDANLGALAEVTWGPHSRADGLVFVKVATGIGCGLYLDGRIYRGALGTAGEIGHSSVDPDGLPCRCGNRGCLETVASTTTILHALAPAAGVHGGVEQTTADVVSHARAGDTATLRVLEDAGAALGRALAGVVNLINPAAIVLGGPLTDAGETLLEPVRRSLRRWAIPQAGDDTAVAMSSLGERAEVLGALALVLRRGATSAVRP